MQSLIVWFCLSQLMEIEMRTISSLSTVGRLHAPRQARRIEMRQLPRLAFRQAVAVLREWRRRSRDRAQLASLDDRMLRDIGVSRGDVLQEINKPFWRR